METGLPAELRDTVIARSARGKTGQVVVRRYSGVTKNAAYRLLRALEEKRGKEDILAALELAGTTSALAVLEAARAPHRKAYSLARLVADAKISPDVIFTQYAAGKVKLLKSFAAADAAEAIAEASEGMPKVVRAMIRRSLPVVGICRTCFGKGIIPAKSTERNETIKCPMCQGSGSEETFDEKSIEAAKIVQEVAGLKSAGIQVNQGVMVKGNGNGGGEPSVSFLRNVHEGRDQILRAARELPESTPHGQDNPVDTVEAVLVDQPKP